MATKIPTAQRRMFFNVFVCKDCQRKVRARPIKIIAGKVKCPRCGGNSFRPVKKK